MPGGAAAGSSALVRRAAGGGAEAQTDRRLTEWNEAHSAELCAAARPVQRAPQTQAHKLGRRVAHARACLSSFPCARARCVVSRVMVHVASRSNPAKPKEKHKFTHGKGCAELNTDRFDDAEKVRGAEIHTMVKGCSLLTGLTPCVPPKTRSTGRERQLGRRLLHGGVRRWMGRG